ncbi:hypothetical protein EV714DRAFT_240288 [Schizophyllum commune]
MRKACAEYHAKIPWDMPDHAKPELPLLVYDLKNPLVQLYMGEEEEEAWSAALTEKNVNPRYGQQYRGNRNSPYDHIVLELASMTRLPKGRNRPPFAVRWI